MADCVRPSQGTIHPSQSFDSNFSTHQASDDSDSDAVNTSNAKVYFGRFQTPEKKIATFMNSAEALSPNVNTPSCDSKYRPIDLRRSPRLSTPPKAVVESAALTESAESRQKALIVEAQPEGWIEAPLPDFLREDEPSSAIASRIMRAHDNPSPPPKSIRDSFSPRHRTSMSGQLPQIPSLSDTSEDPDMESVAAAEFSETTPPPFDHNDESASPTVTMAKRLSTSPTITQPINTLQPCGEDEPNLIEFDRTVLMTSPSNDSLVSPTPRYAATSGVQTVDDLLFSSPCQLKPMDATTDGIGYIPQTSQEEEHSCAERTDCASGAEQPVLVEEHHAQELVSEDDAGKHLEPPEPPKTQSSALSIPVPSVDLSPSPRRSARLSAISSVPSAMEAGPSTPTSITPRGHKRRRSGSSRLSLSPRKVEWQADSDASEEDKGNFESSKSKKTKRLRKVMEAEGEHVEAVQSLSPQSADILRNIAAAELAPNTETLAHQSEPNPGSNLDLSPISPSADETEMLTPQQTPPQKAAETIDQGKSQGLSSVQRPPPGVFAHETQTPVRGSAQPLFSQSKLMMSQSTLEDPNRSPARRVQIKSSSVRKSGPMDEHSNSRINAPGARTPVFSKPLVSLTDPARSPAKRVAMPLPSAKAQAKDLVPSGSKQLKVFAPPSTTKPSSATKMTLPKGSLSSPVRSTGKPKSAVPPSRLARPSSRIPRVGSTAKAGASRTTQLPIPSTSKPESKLRAPKTISRQTPQPQNAPVMARIVQSSSSSSSGSDDSTGSRDALRPPLGAQSGSKALAANRRKREKDIAPAGPMIQARRVTPGMFGGPIRATTLDANKQQAGPVLSSPVKPPAQMRPIQGREVVKGTLQDYELTNPAIISLEAMREARERERAEQERLRQEQVQRELEEKQKQEAAAASATTKTTTLEGEEISSPTRGPSLNAFTFQCPAPAPGSERMDVDSSPISSSQGLGPEEPSSSPRIIPLDLTGSRKSTRPRRQISIPTGVADNRPFASTSRRSGPPKPRSSSMTPALVFSTNGVALKNLTNNNTTRNQYYHAKLEVHVIRREGERPESPTMKLRTVQEKQKEEQGKMRAERAARRRGDSMDTSGMMQDSGLFESAAKHRRGAGEDEDYVTPMKPDNGKKSVKWDRGLEAVVFLDEIEMDAQRRPKAEIIPKKGCLHVKAPLDELGNALNAADPLDLSPEKVVVRKYVYDNDEEALEFDLPPPPPRRGRKSR